MTTQFSVIKEANGSYAVEGKIGSKRTHYNGFHPYTGKPGDQMTEAEAAEVKAMLEELFNVE